MNAGATTLADFGDGSDDTVEEARHVTEGDEVGELVDLSEYQFPDADGVLEMNVTQVDYTVEGYGDEEYPVLHVFGRTADETPEHVRVFDFQPYFYTPIDSLDHETPDEERPLRESDFEDDRLMEERIVGIETKGQRDPSLDDSESEEVVHYESIRGDDLVKVFGQTPRDVGQLRDRFDHYEADILFPNRLLIDKDITSGIVVPDQRSDDGTVKVHHEQIEPTDVAADPRVHTFDIEVDDRSGFPEDGEEKIICMTSHDSYRDEYVAWLYDAPDATVEAPTELGEFDFFDGESDTELRVFDTEEAMHDDYLDYLDETDPDVLTGWNFDDFDAPYYVARLEELGLDSDRLSRVDEVWDSGWGGPNIKGRVVFDLLYAYERRQYSELDSYRLDAVAEQELGVGKERYTGDIGDLWEQDPTRLLEYNLRDVELCVEIDRKVDLISFWSEVATFVGCKLEDATTPGDAVDLYILHKVHGDYALPSKGTVESEEYEGGAVFDPISGIRENVTVLDLKSLYPMCMVTTNASPETKVNPEEYDGETYHAPNGTHFRKEPDGIIREMVDELLTEREQKKAARDEYDPDDTEYKRYDSQQAAVKVIMNSLYGVLGWDRFRLYDKEMGAAVTATGREVIEFTEQSANELGYDIAYGDTDSVMLSLGDSVDKQTAIDTSFDIESHINDSYDAFASEELNAEQHRFEIEFEKLYRRFFQAGKKKRYAGHIIWKEGKDVDDIDITGFEYKRSDIAPVTKEVQKNVLDMIVTEGDVEGVKEYVHDTIEEFQKAERPLEDIGIPGGIGKKLDAYDTDTAQVRGAKYANLLLGTNFQRGSKPKRLYLKKVHPDFWQYAEEELGLDSREDPLYGEFKRDPDVICFEYADEIPAEFEVDWDKMLEKTLRGPIERILESLDVSWEEVRDGQEQTGLSSFM